MLLLCLWLCANKASGLLCREAPTTHCAPWRWTMPSCRCWSRWRAPGRSAQCVSRVIAALAWLLQSRGCWAAEQCAPVRPGVCLSTSRPVPQHSQTWSTLAPLLAMHPWMKTAVLPTQRAALTAPLARTRQPDCRQGAACAGPPLLAALRPRHHRLAGGERGALPLPGSTGGTSACKAV